MQPGSCIKYIYKIQLGKQIGKSLYLGVLQPFPTDSKFTLSKVFVLLHFVFYSDKVVMNMGIGNSFDIFCTEEYPLKYMACLRRKRMIWEIIISLKKMRIYL